MSKPSAFSDFHALFSTPIDVRWRDLDAFNHVNNATYLTYLETARLLWLKQIPGSWFGQHTMPVMASSELNYRRPITWPAAITIKLAMERMGNSSLTIAHQIVDSHKSDTLYCDGRVVMVWMDPATGKSVPLPDAIRDVIH